MALTLNGVFRVQSVYMAEKAAYITLKDKADGSLLKVAHSLPLPKHISDDVLVKLDGAVSSRLFGNNVSLTFNGTSAPAPEK